MRQQTNTIQACLTITSNEWISAHQVLVETTLRVVEIMDLLIDLPAAIADESQMTEHTYMALNMILQRGLGLPAAE